MNALTSQPPRLLDQSREAVRLRHYSLRTGQAYIHWTKRFILLHGKRHPRELGPKDVETLLTFLWGHQNSHKRSTAYAAYATHPPKYARCTAGSCSNSWAVPVRGNLPHSMT
ncbi:phage integrase N-terminal SAM-like domain-containing protein [Candidatus Symbiobacter mobilis]|nr:phage integrase N-terminal SAM-like domain-containing protein [Candidatus Symbiobacter mobilis]